MRLRVRDRSLGRASRRMPRLGNRSASDASRPGAGWCSRVRPLDWILVLPARSARSNRECVIGRHSDGHSLSTGTAAQELNGQGRNSRRSGQGVSEAKDAWPAGRDKLPVEPLSAGAVSANSGHSLPRGDTPLPVVHRSKPSRRGYAWRPSQDQCGMVRPLGTSSADWW